MAVRDVPKDGKLGWSGSTFNAVVAGIFLHEYESVLFDYSALATRCRPFALPLVHMGKDQIRTEGEGISR